MQRKRLKPKRRKPPTYEYKTECDNCPGKRAWISFVEAKTGEMRGLCRDCFREERETAMRRIRIKEKHDRIKARRERLKRTRTKRR